MANQKCEECGKLLEQGDLVSAKIITRFIALKSKIAYALERPTECHEVHHVSCPDPKGENYEILD